MKKRLIVVSLSLIAFVSAGLIDGCGQGTSTPTTTTTTLSAAASASDTAQAAVKAATGVAQTSQSTGDMAATQPSVTSISSLKTFTGQTPPDSFFSALPSNGWITIEGNTFVTGETVQIRMYTKGGEQINAPFLADKKIAEGDDWQNMATGEFDFSSFVSYGNSWLNYPTDWDPSSASKIASFYTSSTKYRACSSLWDYIFYTYVTSHLEDLLDACYKSANQTLTGLSDYPSTGTPEASSSDVLGSQEACVTGTHADGSTIDLTMGVSTDADGKPVSSTGSGTMTTPDGKTMTINSMTMTFSDGAPSSGTMDITIGSPDNMHMVMTITASGGATGTVYSTATSPETELGTIVIFASADADGHWGYFQDATTGTKEYF